MGRLRPYLIFNQDTVAVVYPNMCEKAIYSYLYLAIYIAIYIPTCVKKKNEKNTLSNGNAFKPMDNCDFQVTNYKKKMTALL